MVDAPFSFNRSIRMGSRTDWITGDSGALTGCELLRRSEVARFLAKCLPDSRVVQVVVERPGELIPRCFWLLTSMPADEVSGGELLALYRKHGKAEGHVGELMGVVAPALSSTSRRKSHYRDRRIAKREKGVDPFACN